MQNNLLKLHNHLKFSSQYHILRNGPHFGSVAPKFVPTMVDVDDESNRNRTKFDAIEIGKQNGFANHRYCLRLHGVSFGYVEIVYF